MEGNVIITSITSGLTSLMTWVGSVVESIFTTSGALNVIAPMIGVAIATTIVYFGVGLIKSLIKGY